MKMSSDELSLQSLARSLSNFPPSQSDSSPLSTVARLLLAVREGNIPRSKNINIRGSLKKVFDF